LFQPGLQSQAPALTVAMATRVSKLRSRLHRLFSKVGVPDPGASAKYLLAHCIGQRTLTREHSRLELTAQQLSKLTGLCNRRLQREPLQYILGEWYFRDVSLVMRAPVFIPRPETEKLVDLAKQCWSAVGASSSHPHSLSRPRLFSEVCTGSGAVSVCLLRDLPQAHCLAIELLPEACHLTWENCHRNGVSNRLHLINASLATPGLLGRAPPLSLIVANPPYVPELDMRQLQPEVTFESPVALRGGGIGGLGVIVQLMDFADARLATGGWLAFEMDSSHGQLLRDRFQNRGSLRLDRIESDFADKERFCLYRKL
uniref:PrmC_N domain-containing protein n=2 Tax=Macrostomum lignano TaxID=282301 RepID=A0A1I8JIB1_9PLAT